MHANGIGVGVKADQQQVNGSPATKALFDSFTEGLEPCHASGDGEPVIGTMGGAALMAGIDGTEVINDALEVAGRVMGSVGIALAGAAMLGFNPALNGVLNVKQGPSVWAPANAAQRNAQGVGDGMG